MSYPYDVNPWDDNYSQPEASNQPQGYSQPYDGSSGAYGGSYNDQSDAGLQQQQQQQPQAYYSDGAQTSPAGGQQSEQQFQQEDGPPKREPESFCSRFLRANIPSCGPLMDSVSLVCTPISNTLLKYVNRDLLVSKMFYFFFFSAFGSLFPLMGVYFKQLGMNPAQVGILTGVRPFIEIFSAPFWSSLAERFQKSKALLLFSLISWIIFTYSLAHIRPPASSCIAYDDHEFRLYTPYSENDLRNYDIDHELQHPQEYGGEPADEAERQFSSSSGERQQAEETRKFVSDESRRFISVGDEVEVRRRRSKRQVDHYADQSGSKASRFVYSIDIPTDSDAYSSVRQPMIDLDLENDFEDSPTSYERARDSGGSMSFYDSEDSRMGAMKNNDEYNELHQMLGVGGLVRQRRAARNGDDDENSLGDRENQSPDGDEEQANESSTAQTNEPNEESEQANADNEPNENTLTETGHMSSTQAPVSSSTTQAVPQANKTRRIYKQRHKTPPTHVVGKSPISVEYAANYNKDKQSQWVTPMFSTIVYKLDDIKEVFFLLLLLISLGEFFSAPAITIADNITLSYLGVNTDHYGRQRMFGSLSWAVTLLLVGMALDNSTKFADHPCGPHYRERSYTVCFAIFSALMFCAFLTATQFNFRYPAKAMAKSGSGSQQQHQQKLLTTAKGDSASTVVTTTVDGTAAAGNIDEFYANMQPRNIFNTAPPVNAPPPKSEKEKFEFLDKCKSAVFARSSWELPEFFNVFRQFKSSLHLTYLFITWFLGCGVGLVFTFLFWHLQDVGGTPTLFGICSVINHISEILAYFFSSNFIKRFGHTKVLSVGLGCNVIRFLYVAFLSNPYYALPFELVQGITHAACFAACCSYMSHVSTPELRTSTQGVMQGLHHGIGRACGALIGGYMINAIGSRASFCIYGLCSGFVLAGFLYIRRKTSLQGDEVVEVEDDDEALGGYGAPQGVPSAIPGKIGQPVTPQDIEYQW